MSADLFAEFNNPPESSTKTQPQVVSTSSSNDHFSFGAASSKSPLQSQIQWQSPQAQSSSMSGWDQPPQPSQSSHTQAPSALQGEDEDTWGDFEVAEPEAASASQPDPKISNAPSLNTTWDSQGAFSSVAGWTSQAPAAAFPPGGLFDAAYSEQDVAAHPPIPAKTQSQKSSVADKSNDPNVLFDADDFELQGGDDEGFGGDDFDEFGDFESTATETKPRPVSTPQPVSISASLDLLGLDDTPVVATKAEVPNQAPRPASATLSFGTTSANQPQSYNMQSLHQMESSFSDLNMGSTAPKPSLRSHSAKQPSVSKSRPVALAIASDDQGDDWAAWDDPPTPKEVTASHEAPSADWGWGNNDDDDGGGGGGNATATQQDDSAPPPTNVPPPAILLSSFPDLFNTGNSLLKPVAGQSISIKAKVLADAKASQFLHGYVLVGATAARIIAGRKHRWHRDKILAKSMSISAAGSKGMKLAGVDKTQSAREDREAADVAAAWRENIGRLRSAVAAANSVGKVNIKVPEVSENMLVQTAKMVPTAAKPCVICGLKREERIAKVDYDVEDSFGEWWVEHWGHRACKNFWIEHEQKLRQR